MDLNLKAHRAAFSFVLARPLPEHAAKTDMERLVQLTAAGRTDVIVTYVIVFRYALIHSGASGEDHAASLVQLRAKLEPLVVRDPTSGPSPRGCRRPARETTLDMPSGVRFSRMGRAPRRNTMIAPAEACRKTRQASAMKEPHVS